MYFIYSFASCELCGCVQVRTKDDALISVKLMLFFELKDIERMLNQTTDPVGDFIKWVT